MVDAVLAGDGLDAVATLAADATGGAVAIVLPAVGAAVAGPGGQRLAAVRRYVSAQLAGQPSPVPPGYVAEAPVHSGADQLGAIVLLDGGRPVAPTAEGVLRLAAVAALTAAALRDAVGAGPRATSALLDELR